MLAQADACANIRTKTSRQYGGKVWHHLILPHAVRRFIKTNSFISSSS